jgi:hypothetical protein
MKRRVTPEPVIGPRLARTRWANPPCGYLPTEADMFRMIDPEQDRATIVIMPVGGVIAEDFRLATWEPLRAPI